MKETQESIELNIKYNLLIAQKYSLLSRLVDLERKMLDLQALIAKKDEELINVGEARREEHLLRIDLETYELRDKLAALKSGDTET